MLEKRHLVSDLSDLLGITLPPPFQNSNFPYNPTLKQILFYSIHFILLLFFFLGNQRDEPFLPERVFRMQS
jgi:hypothetical protein